MNKWLLLGAAIASEVTATMALKAALDRPALYVVVATGYVASFVLLAAVLRRGMGLGVAYGIWGALGVVCTAVLSAVIYGEPLTLLMGLGIAVIIAGVLLVEIGSQAARAEREG
ncbi:DMT family transporter [Cryptosporangium arvum]|uniref:Cation/cationic drug transporter n=1 Tax=Cryptosporangium arvum DSM 44712 TaxID=927661 RepID=A0A010YJ89_9ACTN|nr:SMR family transporter [Cryptosporangium arvum]EXG80265.1 cation/cationic drug transporter [Cryptosporangium arvum DSM 44712]